MVSDEVMRLLMLPQPKGCDPNEKPPTDGNCPECQPIDELSKKIENLIKCAEKKEEKEGEVTEQEEAEEEVEEGAEEEGAEEEGECMPPAMFAMELITCNEKVDEEIKNLYETIIAAEEEAERNNGFDSLNSYKKLRDSIDDVIIELMDETDDEKLKKIVKRNLRLVRISFMF